MSSTSQSSIGPWRQVGRRLCRNRAALVGIGILILLACSAIFAPLLSPFSYEEQDLALGPVPPCIEHPLGTDALGRDLLTRTLYGGRISLMIGICATAVSLLIGITYGALAGYVGGRTDAFLMRLVDVLYALPFTVFVIILMVVFGQHVLLLFVAIGAVEWLTMARIVRGQVLAVKQQLYVKAAEVLGYSHARIIARHVVPNVMGPVIVYATLTVPRVILMESFLSFLGLGVQPPMSSWGLLIRDGATAMESYPWMMIVPGVVLWATLFALNFIGDGLRDAIDPRST